MWRVKLKNGKNIPVSDSDVVTYLTLHKDEVILVKNLDANAFKSDDGKKVS